MEHAGMISDLTLQPKFDFPVDGEAVRYADSNRKLTYTADFAYTTPTGERIVEDAKGVATQVYKIKKALMLAVHGVRVRES